jgi:hypothetical protein
VNGPARVISEQHGILNLQEVVADFAVRLQASDEDLTGRFEGTRHNDSLSIIDGSMHDIGILLKV